MENMNVDWVTGFVKGANDAGITDPAEVESLMLSAQRLELYNRHPEKYAEAYEAELVKAGMEKQALPPLAIAGLGAAGMGAAGYLGGKIKNWWGKKTDPYGQNKPMDQRTMGQYQKLQNAAQQARGAARPFMRSAGGQGQGGARRWYPSSYGF
jgi:hypothetical protein